ncbi:MAG: proton-conducting transporter membrane subunit [Sulfurimonas sp.]|nr:proton-conducting transporter membrane subunit [Sulfurimonas sp.]
MFIKSIRSILLYLAAYSAIPALLASLLVSPDQLQWDFPWLLLGVKIGLDTTGQIFLLVSALLWSVSGIYAKTYFKDENQQLRFYRFFLLAMAGNFGLIVSGDIFSFYLFFTLMSFASYGLVAFRGDKEAFYAGLVYIVLVVVGEVMLFVALLMLAHASDATTFEAIRESYFDNPNKNIIIFLLFTAFGIKAGVIGVHVWLPLAHPLAPTPASAVLSGAMIKAGLLGWLRLLPLGENILLEWAIGIMFVGVIAQVYGVIIGLTQCNPKTLLAYSSISQMGIMTMLIGLGFYAPESWEIILTGIIFFTLHHGLSKGALFLGVGALGTHNRVQRYAIWFGLFIPALALAAAPWSSGMIAKHLVKSCSTYLPSPWDTALEIVLFIGAINTALLMIRLLYLVRPNATPFGINPSLSLLYPWIGLLLSIILLPFVFQSSYAQMSHLPVLAFIYPILLSIIIATLAFKTKKLQDIKPVPAGDILVLFERSIKLLNMK